MPITSEGEKVLSSMKKTYGADKAEQVFYATANKRKKNSAWHSKGKGFTKGIRGQSGRAKAKAKV